MLILNPATVSSYLPYRNGLYRKYCCQKHGFLDYFFSGSPIDFMDAGDPPMLTGPLPDPQNPPNPQNIDFSLGGGRGGRRPINALLTRVGAVEDAGSGLV